jgi:hypothetical protein
MKPDGRFDVADADMAANLADLARQSGRDRDDGGPV